MLWVCVCSRRYPACNAHAPYCHLLPIRLYSIFQHYLINRTIFGGEGGEVIEHKMCVLIPARTFVWNIILRKLERHVNTNMYWSLRKLPVIFMSYFHGTWIFVGRFWNNTRVSNLMKIFFSGSRVIPCERTDGTWIGLLWTRNKFIELNRLYTTYK